MADTMLRLLQSLRFWMMQVLDSDQFHKNNALQGQVPDKGYAAIPMAEVNAQYLVLMASC